jgi:abortive infection bacteriophage resistance protein
MEKYTKPPLTIEKQIDLLKSRNMIIDSDKEAINFLMFNNYYRFAGYWKKLADKHTHIFTNNENNKFNDIVEIYQADEKLRKMILQGLESFEIALKTQFAYELSIKHGSHFHLKSELFNSYFEENKQHLKKEFDRCKEKYKKHYFNNYEEELPPIWVTVELMSFGTLSKCFDSLINDSDKNLISNNFNYHRDNFISFVKFSAYLRNCCAHYSILWKTKLTKAPSIPNSYAYINQRINKKNIKSLFNCIVILQYLLDQINDGEEFRKQINEFLCKTKKEILNYYGIKDNLTL